MRDFKGMKRQRGRNRSVGGGGQGGGGKPQQNANRAFDSNGPEGVKVRGHAQSVYEKYQQLARDAFSAGDRVLAENHLQHAEHYFRLLRLIQPTRPTSEIVARDVFASGIDIDFEDEGGENQFTSEPDGPGEAQAADGAAGGDGGQDRQRTDGRYDRNDRYANDRNGDRYQNDRPQADRNGADRPQAERAFGDRNRQNDRPQNDRPQNDRPQNERAQNERPQNERAPNERPQNEQRPREDRPRYERQTREERPQREERAYGRDDRAASAAFPAEDPLAVIRPESAPFVAPSASAPTLAPAAFAPTELSAEAEVGSPILRSQDGGVSEAPAFLQAMAPTAPLPADADEAPRRPRTRARRRPAAGEGDEGFPARETSARETEEV